VKKESLTDSRSLLQKISKKLDSDTYVKFKVALINYSQAKKSGDEERKLKYYQVLKVLFQDEVELFKEIEKFIKYDGPSENTNLSNKVVSLKRKHADN
jgi:hypothetical protein